VFIAWFIFFVLSTKRKIFDRAIIFATFIKSITKIKWRRIMKKTDKKSDLLSVEVIATIDVKGHVKIGNGGGGRQTFV
jgi:hypothetical protein